MGRNVPMMKMMTSPITPTTWMDKVAQRYHDERDYGAIHVKSVGMRKDF